MVPPFFDAAFFAPAFFAPAFFAPAFFEDFFAALFVAISFLLIEGVTRTADSLPSVIQTRACDRTPHRRQSRRPRDRDRGRAVDRATRNPARTGRRARRQRSGLGGLRPQQGEKSTRARTRGNGAHFSGDDERSGSPRR